MALKQHSILSRTSDEDIFLVVTGVIKGRVFFEPTKWSRLACGCLCLAYLVAIYLLQGWTLFVCSILLFIAAIVGTEMMDSDSEKRWQTISFSDIESGGGMPLSSTKRSMVEELVDLEASRKNYIMTARSDINIVTERNDTNTSRSQQLDSARAKLFASTEQHVDYSVKERANGNDRKKSIEIPRLALDSTRTVPVAPVAALEMISSNTPGSARSLLNSARSKPSPRQMYASNHKLEATM